MFATPANLSRILLASLRLAAIALWIAVPLAHAQGPQPEIITGTPLVQESGRVTINGQDIALWGIDTLAPDQQCWQDEAAWCCGEQATMALRHFVEGRLLECKLKSKPESGPALAQCYRQKGRAPMRDVSELLVRHGWAMDHSEVSGGAYLTAEEEARQEKRGVWDSRFQTAKDWKQGIQRFVGEPEETPAAAPHPKDQPADASSGEEEEE